MIGTPDLRHPPRIAPESARTLDPNQFEAETATYFRFTRWRQTRALVQLLANLGAMFTADTDTASLAKAPRVSTIPTTGRISSLATIRTDISGGEMLRRSSPRP
jgi:hypothetical protein